MRRFVLALLASVLVPSVVVLSPLRAQSLALRLGLGPELAVRHLGGTGVVAGELALSSFLLRAEARGVLTGGSANYGGSARMLLFGGGVGFVKHSASGGSRTYGLATLATGLDPRESDHVTGIGAVLGSDLTSRPGAFAELRYERWIQRGVRYYDLDSNTVSLVVGVRIP